MNEITFRQAEIEDLPILFEFEQGIVTAERPFTPTLKDGHINYYDIKALIESDDAEVLVALNDKEIIASGYIKINKSKPYIKLDEYGYIGFMFVKPEYRGKRVSQKMLEELKQWAKSRNLQELRLEVYDENLNAISAYERFGFRKHLVEMRVDL